MIQFRQIKENPAALFVVLYIISFYYMIYIQFPQNSGNL